MRSRFQHNTLPLLILIAVYRGRESIIPFLYLQKLKGSKLDAPPSSEEALHMIVFSANVVDEAMLPGTMLDSKNLTCIKH